LETLKHYMNSQW